jgi:hypothetical protein
MEIPSSLHFPKEEKWCLISTMAQPIWSLPQQIASVSLASEQRLDLENS